MIFYEQQMLSAFMWSSNDQITVITDDDVGLSEN
jgi:hypothetical protein